MWGPSKRAGVNKEILALNCTSLSISIKAFHSPRCPTPAPPPTKASRMQQFQYPWFIYSATSVLFIFFFFPGCSSASSVWDLITTGAIKSSPSALAVGSVLLVSRKKKRKEKKSWWSIQLLITEEMELTQERIFLLNNRRVEETHSLECYKSPVLKTEETALLKETPSNLTHQLNMSLEKSTIEFFLQDCLLISDKNYDEETA